MLKLLKTLQIKSVKRFTSVINMILTPLTTSSVSNTWQLAYFDDCFMLADCCYGSL